MVDEAENERLAKLKLITEQLFNVAHTRKAEYTSEMAKSDLEVDWIGRNGRTTN
jgi:hypothetical protein